MRYLLWLGLLWYSITWGQIDNGKTFSPIRLDNSKDFLTKSTGSGIPYKSVLDKEDAYLKRFSVLDKKEDKQPSVLEMPTYKNPGDRIKDKLNSGDGTSKAEYSNGVFYGELGTTSRYIKIVCRDHEYPDGDIVTILQNDNVAVPSFVLEAAPKEYYLTLLDGFNKIQFVALNQGESGPNTAAFSVYDDKGNLLLSNIWNLNTGAKALLVIVKR